MSNGEKYAHTSPSHNPWILRGVIFSGLLLLVIASPFSTLTGGSSKKRRGGGEREVLEILPPQRQQDLSKSKPTTGDSSSTKGLSAPEKIRSPKGDTFAGSLSSATLVPTTEEPKSRNLDAIKRAIGEPKKKKKNSRDEDEEVDTDTAVIEEQTRNPRRARQRSPRTRAPSAALLPQADPQEDQQQQEGPTGGEGAENETPVPFRRNWNIARKKWKGVGATTAPNLPPLEETGGRGEDGAPATYGPQSDPYTTPSDITTRPRRRNTGGRGINPNRGQYPAGGGLNGDSSLPSQQQQQQQLSPEDQQHHQADGGAGDQNTEEDNNNNNSVSAGSSKIEYLSQDQVFKGAPDDYSAFDITPLGCEKRLLWFLSICWHGKSRDQFSKMVLANLRSMHVNAKGGLVPILLVYSDMDGKNHEDQYNFSHSKQGGDDGDTGNTKLLEDDPDFQNARFLVESLGGYVRIRNVNQSYPFKFYDINQRKDWAIIWAGALGRLEALHILRDELPEIYPKSLGTTIDNTRIAYSDTDTLFMPPFNHCEFPTPAYVSFGSEIAKNSGFNAGIVMLNALAVSPEIMDKVMTGGASFKPPFQNVDQGTLQGFFKPKRGLRAGRVLSRTRNAVTTGGATAVNTETMYSERYPVKFNYKCQWGGRSVEEASIMHFWGPKPGKGGGLTCNMRVNPRNPEIKRAKCGIDNIPMMQGYEPIWAMAQRADGNRFCKEMDRIWHEYAYGMTPMRVPKSSPPLNPEYQDSRKKITRKRARAANDFGPSGVEDAGIETQQPSPLRVGTDAGEEEK